MKLHKKDACRKPGENAEHRIVNVHKIHRRLVSKNGHKVT